MALSWVVEWAKEVNDKRWINIENVMSNTHLRRIIWNPPQHRVLGPNTHEITRTALKIWDRIHTQNKRDYNSPLIFLKENEYFEPGKRSVGGNWIKKENTQLKDIIKRCKISTYHKLSLDLMTIDAWQYIQLSHFVEKLPQPIRSGEDYRPLELLCMKEK